MKTFMIILLVLVAIFLVWYIVSFRGVNKDKVKIIEQQSNLKVGSNVVLSSGIHGKVSKVNKETIEVVIDKAKNVTITVERYCISKVL
ncbi:preprotein translocase subunit YajC [Clostridium perfringens]|nr:preprotein translocase subunit YajC [Clostridium perfringens]